MTEKPDRHMISFIIPALNAEKFIAACIDHILAEMAENDELIVVDNGSTDATLDIVRKYGKATIMQFPDSTIATLRNRGSEIARSDLFAFIDSDCLIGQGWRQAVESVMSDESVHATGSRYDIPDPPHWIEKAWYAKKSKGVRPINYINSGNLVVRRSAYEAVGGFDEQLVTDEDCDLGKRLNRAGFVVLEAPRVRAVHLGNPKSLKDFFGKEKWHATSSLSSLARGVLDKPTLMTMVFMLCAVLSLVMLPSLLLGKANVVILPGLLLFVPIVTSIYRALQYGVWRHLGTLIILYFVFYIARALIIVQYAYDRIWQGFSAGNSSAGKS